ncbi:MAG TPA: DUF3048 domain-containing protein [Ilumatobacteraceae bacterium]|nr:DUF3048 domain-containing protein [Ilumatobacteraceae bacterium]
MTSTIHRTSVVALVVAFLAACSSGGGNADSTTSTTTRATSTTTASTTTTTTVARTTTSTSTSTSTTTTLPVIVREPLTGEPVSSADEIVQRPALVVKIDNHPRARPQSGLNQADIVFEEIVEGTLTRFAAVFQSGDADPVGPIRSGRSQDVDMLGPLNGPVFAWSGGNGGVRALIRNSDFINLDAGFTPGYYRRSGRGGAPHNLYSSTTALWANVPPEKMAAPPAILSYLRPEETFTGQAATIVDVPMDGVRVRWEWDADDEVYRRFQNDNSHDTEDAGQVIADNIVVMGVEYHRSAADPKSPEAQTLGSGPVYVFAEGKLRIGVWIHLDRLDPYGLVAADDSLIELPAGRTWIELAYNAENFVTWQG